MDGIRAVGLRCDVAAGVGGAAGADADRLALAAAGERPWGWWEFDAGEEMPSDIADTRRLVELGALAREELADVNRLGEESLAAQVAGTIASVSVPTVVRRAQVVRRAPELPPLDEAPFHRYSAGVRDH